MRSVLWVCLGCLLLAGCNKQVAEDPDLKPAEPKVKKVVAAWPTNVSIFKNAKGEVACPVMGSSIESPEKAVGYQDHEGTRYYFCCSMCPPKFKENPKQYALKSGSSKSAK